MALWLERRDEKGVLIFRGRFSGGRVVVRIDGPDCVYEDSFDIQQAVGLARLSAHLPVGQRDWVLRIAD